MEIPSQVYQESIYRMSGAHRGTVQRCPVTDMGEQESFRAIVSHKNFEEKKKKKRFKYCLFSPILLHCPKMAYFICV